MPSQASPQIRSWLYSGFGLLLGLFASAAWADSDTALYAELDALAPQALAELPTSTHLRSPGRIVWFATAAEADDLAALEMRLRDANGALIAEFRLDAEPPDSLPHPLGSHAHPGAGEYILETVGLAEDGERIRHEASLSLDGGEQIIRLRASGEGLRNRNPQLRVWSEAGGAGLVRRTLEWFGIGDSVTRLALHDDLMEAPDVRHAQQRCQRSDDALGGLVDLRAIGQGGAGQPPALRLARARCALTLGLRGIAADELAALDVEAVAARRLVAPVVGLAALDIERGQPERAERVLRALEPLIEPREHAAFLDRLSMALMRQDKIEEAAEVLAEGPHLSVSQIWDEEGVPQPVLAFMLLNHGVTLAGTGRRAEALSVFDIVGQRDSRGPMGRALRDRANLVLGGELLRLRQGSEAAAVFDRVNLDGPRAGAALLGRGWAVLQGPSERLARDRVRALSRAGMSETALRAMFRSGIIGCFEMLHFTQDIGGCTGGMRFDRAALQAEDARQPAAAMRYWEPLMQRDARDANVLQGYLAAAEAQLLAGDVSRAQALLDDGIARLEAVEQRMAAAERRLAARGVPRPDAPLSENAEQAEADLRYWLLDWASSPEAARRAQGGELLRTLAQRLRGQAEEPRSRSQALAERFDRQHREMAADALAQRGEELRSLRADARLMMARIYDRPAR